MKYERMQVYSFGEIDQRAIKIGVNPNARHSFIAIGENFVRAYSTSERKFKEIKDPIINSKYEKGK
jgi:hypothetical protein